MNRETPPWIWTLLLALAVALPLVLHARGQDFYISMLSRMMIYGIAACSLNLILGFGGLVSFGHAAFVGIGAYAVGIMITEGFTNGWLNFAVAMGISALAAAVIGAISLRTRGVYFIMITLAFAQMIYYLVNSIKAYGGDEGLNIKSRSNFGMGLDLKNDVTFYFVVLVVLVLTLVIISRKGRRDWLSSVYLQMGSVHHCRDLGRSGWCSDGEPSKLRQPQPDALDPIWHLDGHGHLGWRRHTFRWLVGCIGLAHFGRPDCRTHGLLAVLHRLVFVGGRAAGAQRLIELLQPRAQS